MPRPLDRNLKVGALLQTPIGKCTVNCPTKLEFAWSFAEVGQTCDRPLF